MNTPVCEQLFSAINKYTNAKAMNEAHFFIFFLYIFDLHNLQIEGKLRSTANPMSDHRSELIKNLKSTEVDEISDRMANIELTMNDKSQKDKTKTGAEELSCHLCACKYKRSRDLKAHLEKKHEGFKESVNLCKVCGETFACAITLQTHMEEHYTCTECGNSFMDVKYLNRHMKTQHSPVLCKVCNSKCPSKDALEVHMKVHLDCVICGKNFDKMYKLNRHMKSHS